MLTANCMNGTADGVLCEERNEVNCTVAMEGLTVTESSQLSDVCGCFIQQYTILTVIIIELQNIMHTKIKRLENLFDMNRYFLKNE